MMCCRSRERYLAGHHSCLGNVSIWVEFARWKLAFDPEVGERRSVRNELGFDAWCFERVSTLRIW
jgi:hypothetical protein